MSSVSEVATQLREHQPQVANILLAIPQRHPSIADLCSELLAPSLDAASGTVVVTFNETPDQWLEDHRKHLDTLPSVVGIVGVGEQTRSAAFSQPSSGVTNDIDVQIETVASPGNFTKLGVRATGCLGDIAERGNITDVAFCFRDLAPLVVHADTETVYKFLYSLTGQVTASGAFGHYHVDPRSLEEQTLLKLMPLFDAIVEFDGSDDLRIRTQ